MSPPPMFAAAASAATTVIMTGWRCWAAATVGRYLRWWAGVREAGELIGCAQAVGRRGGGGARAAVVLWWAGGGGPLDIGLRSYFRS